MTVGTFTSEQVIGILHEHEAGVPLPELCRAHGIYDVSSSGAVQVGSGKYDADRVIALEIENARLKKLLADVMLDNAGLANLVARKR